MKRIIKTRIKERLVKQRDAMVADLFTRVLFDQNNLHSDAMEAHKNMIRVSFELSQRDASKFGEQQTSQNNTAVGESKLRARRIKRHF